ncbi:MAG: T9SS type A sorting domain-containing protein [Nonlabens sp.]
MKQIIQLLIILFFAVHGYGQSQLLSSKGQFLDSSTSTFVNNDARDYSYDSNGNLVESIYYRWDQFNSQWIQVDRELYTYNNNNQVVLNEYQLYNSSTGSYEAIDRTLHNYDSSGKIIEVISTEPINGQFQPYARSRVTYNNGRLSSFVFDDWNGTSWVEEARDLANYNSNNQLSVLNFEELINGNYELYGREVFTYNSTGKIIVDEFQDWDGTTFTGDERIEFSFDQTGNLINEVYLNTNLPDPNDQEITFYDTAVSINNIDHPFKDKTGLDYYDGSLPYVNKPLRIEGQDYNVNTSSYEDTESITTFNYNNGVLNNEKILAKSLELILYPNPAKDIVNIFTDTIDINLTAEVFDTTGKKLVTFNSRELNVSKFPVGIYLVRITDQTGNRITKKLIKN